MINVQIDGYFASSNSGEGFKNYYHEVFGRVERIYVIKGGPGTGKSRFMRDVAKYAKSRGWYCENYYCSSDPASLDGIIMTRESKCVGVIDGTPPHAWEPQLPGAREQMINLGDFWDADALRERADEIERINRVKNACWKRAYKWLEGCTDMCDIIRSQGERLLNEREVTARASAMLSGVPDGDGFSARTALIDSVGMMGRVSSEAFEHCDTVYAVHDNFLTADILLRAFIGEAQRKKLKIVVSYDPIDPRRVDGVMVDGGQVSAVVVKQTAPRDSEQIYMREMCACADDTVLNEVHRAESCYEKMLLGAKAALADVGNCHFKLEQIYVSAMDFEAKQRFTEDFCVKVFGE